MSRAPIQVSALAITALILSACSEPDSAIPTAPLADLAASRPEFPPDGWVFHPAVLPTGFKRWECTFPNTVAVPGPNAACRETQWGNSGIYRELIRDLVVTGPAAQELCHGPAHFDVIRVCSLAWVDSPETPWGEAGPVGCVVATEPVLVCGVA
jgi:hypothetical protein